MNAALFAYAEKLTRVNVHPAVKALAERARGYHNEVVAVLAYGSALRDAAPENTLVDLYLLTRQRAGISANPISRAACMLVPPNVYYLETMLETKTFRAKYAVLPTELLAAKVRATTANPYFWARFAQPTQLVWAVDDVAATRVLQILTTAMETAAAHARALAADATLDAQWQALFLKTYATELRPEDATRARMIVDTQKQHFETISRLAQPVTETPMNWTFRQWQGRGLSLLRLLKAAFTFQGGADYAAWKIKRHSGVDVPVKNWHRKHPVLAAIVMLPHLLRRGALK